MKYPKIIKFKASLHPFRWPKTVTKSQLWWAFLGALFGEVTVETAGHRRGGWSFPQVGSELLFSVPDTALSEDETFFFFFFAC